MITRLQLQTCADALTVPDGGFTVDVQTGRNPVRGFIVSAFPGATHVLTGPVDTQDLIEYMTRHWDALLNAGNLMGGWHDPRTGKIHLDISIWVADSRQAERLGHVYGQLAYFDLDRGESVACAPAVL